MRVLWVCNVVIPEISDEFGFKRRNVGGWLSGMWNQIRKNPQINLGICVPIIDYEKMKDGITKYNNKYYSYKWQNQIEGYEEQVQRFSDILEQFNPDVVHIWGTEYIHTMAMVEACKSKKIIDKVIINIQGIIYKYTEKYMYGLEDSYKDDIYISMKKRCPYEINALKNVQYVCGRTDWDKASVMLINPNIKYYHCGEILRDIFYDNNDKWNYKKSKKHSIFISQANYPVKGLHVILSQLSELKKYYPDLLIRISGTDITKSDSVYSRMIYKEIVKSNLLETITFLGMLSEEQMYREYLRANVFLSPSLIENSSNSICEAMSVGTPVVSSYVGGVPSIIVHGENGFLYPLDEPYMMTFYIKKLFEDIDLTEKISDNEIKRFNEFNNRQSSVKQVIELYNKISKL